MAEHRNCKATVSQNEAEGIVPPCSKPSAAEEVLLQALRSSRRNILQIEQLQEFLEGALERETKQFERIQFGLKRATADAAYIRTLRKMRQEQLSRDALTE